MQKSEKMPEWDGDRVVTHVSSQDMRPRASDHPSRLRALEQRVAALAAEVAALREQVE